MSKEGDMIMNAQRRYKRGSKGRRVDRLCPICLRLESKGHGPLCPRRKGGGL